MTSHPFRWFPFLAAACFTLILLGWLVETTDLLTADQLRIAGPITLIALGLAGVALTFRSGK